SSGVDQDRALAWALTALHDRARRAELPVADGDDGLRERKKRETRQAISDTATRMFLERGFDAVRVAEIAHACGVSEKTVFNYFPSKEALVLDRNEGVAESVRRSLCDRESGRTLVQAMVELIESAVGEIFSHVDSAELDDEEVAFLHRFLDMVETTPALRAYQRDHIDHVVQVAARALGERVGVDPEDPEPQVAAYALVGLWALTWRSVLRHTRAGMPPSAARDAVVADVRRAARLLDAGLWCFAIVAQGAAHQEQFREAAQAMERAGRQVARAVRESHRAWARLTREQARRRRR
ncbi:MAG TPA: TetR family transcriptional regulator, partial [Acidimicrobiales bacterium]|nr:TetR family transcriptional regulator [Acidimicrobiales bacterium]